LNYFALQYVDYPLDCMLFQKRLVCIKLDLYDFVYIYIYINQYKIIYM